MKNKKMEALVSLLDDEDWEVSYLVEKEIRHLGGEIIPFLENHWEQKGNEPDLQKRIEEIIHDIQFEAVKTRLIDWKTTRSDNLLEGLWAIATYQTPDLLLESLESQLHDMYFNAWFSFRNELHPHDQIKLLNQFYFDKLQFQPNTKQYHSVANSMINQVLETRKGNPISMCAVYLILAQRLGIPLYGVNFPNLFILTYKTEGVQFYINVFNKGVTFSKPDIDHFIKQMNIEPLEIFYEPCTNEEIVRRMLRNLIVSYEKQDETEKAKEIKELLQLLDTHNEN
jgi:regulator of sirC expression with transglutaminase-like and TPR domain